MTKKYHFLFLLDRERIDEDDPARKTAPLSYRNHRSSPLESEAILSRRHKRLCSLALTAE